MPKYIHVILLLAITFTYSVTPTNYETKDVSVFVEQWTYSTRFSINFLELGFLYCQSCLDVVYQADVSAGWKLESETKVRNNPDYEAELQLT